MTPTSAMSGCKAFEGSYRKDPAVTTLMNLADCREKNLQFATAWGYFLDVVRLSRERPEAAAFGGPAGARAAKLEAKLSYLIVNVPADAHVEGLQITRNGVIVDEAEWNTDLPIDGGEYNIEGKAPGYEAWTTKIIVGPANDKRSVNVPRFRERPVTDVRDATSPGPTSVGAVGATTGTGEVRDGGPASGRTRAIAVMSVGGGLLLGGLAVGYLAQQKWWEAEKVCGDDHVCDTAVDRTASEQLMDSARMRGNISTVLVGAGLVAGGVGTYLFLKSRGQGDRVADDDTSLRVTPIVSGREAAVVVGGSF